MPAHAAAAVTGRRPPRSGAPPASSGFLSVASVNRGIMGAPSTDCKRSSAFPQASARRREKRARRLHRCGHARDAGL